MMMPAIKHMRIFMSFHHICLRTRFAPRRKPCAETARLSVLSCRASRRSPRCETLLMFSLMTPTVSSICYNIVSQTIPEDTHVTSFPELPAPKLVSGRHFVDQLGHGKSGVVPLREADLVASNTMTAPSPLIPSRFSLDIPETPVFDAINSTGHFTRSNTMLKTVVPATVQAVAVVAPMSSQGV
jgi:hypothetical protein